MTERIKIADNKPDLKNQTQIIQFSGKTEISKSVNTPVDRILFLQRTIGNQAVARLFESEALQTKLADSGHAVLPSYTSGKLSEREGMEKAIESLKSKVFRCPPAPDSAANTAGIAGAGTLGFHKIDKSSKLLCAPNFDVDKGFCTFKPVVVNLSMTSKFAKVEPPASLGQTMKLPGCGTKDVPVFAEITPDISMLVQKGEQEHCDDLNLAFTQTLVPCANALNKMAGQKLTGKNENECFKTLIARLGFDPLNCSQEFADLSLKSMERDDRGFHDFDPVLISKTCDKIIVGYKKSATNKIGDPGVAPGKFIPAATKCSSPSAAQSPSGRPPPSTPPPGSPAPPQNKEITE
ncbi:Uncharacterised protein [uncultured archaeon]|nr:Uncharacterised protein [uncultured archaeon]